MGNRTLRLHRPLDEDITELWFTKEEDFISVDVFKPLLQKNIRFPAGGYIFKVSDEVFSALLGGIIYGVEKNNEGYISQSSNVVVVIVVTWGSWFLSFAAFIPISLLVTVELVRYGQGKILAKDELCSSKGLFAEVQTSNLN